MIRVLDIILSLTALVVLSPLFLIVCFVLRLTGEGKVFYLQQRVGKDGKFFNLIKFVTMLENSPNMHTGTITLKNDPRVLPFGRYLRMTKVNELPQLLNIFIGDMSVIGPRPCRLLDALRRFLKRHKKIIQIKPGLSGIGSIYFRSEEEILSQSDNANSVYDNYIMPFKADLEIYYIQNISVRLYVFLYSQQFGLL